MGYCIYGKISTTFTIICCIRIFHILNKIDFDFVILQLSSMYAELVLDMLIDLNQFLNYYKPVNMFKEILYQYQYQ